MTENKALKRRIRERMAKTGETYTAARTNVTRKRDRKDAAERKLTVPNDRPSEASVVEATGKTWDDWFAILDAWDATSKKHGEIARFLNEEHGVPGWWSQSVTVAFERARGLRMKHQRPDGFAISASKTVAVAVEQVYEAFVDDVARKRWLPEVSLTLRTAQEPKSARFDWEDGTTRIAVWFTPKGDAKAVVSLSHERLPDADEAETMKAAWREYLARLKALLES